MYLNFLLASNKKYDTFCGLFMVWIDLNIGSGFRAAQTRMILNVQENPVKISYMKI